MNRVASNSTQIHYAHWANSFLIPTEIYVPAKNGFCSVNVKTIFEIEHWSFELPLTSPPSLSGWI